MPIYEYRCMDCGGVSEILVLGKSDSVRCKDCGGTVLTKLMSAHNAPAASSGRETPESGRCCGSRQHCGNPGGFCCNS